MKPCEAERRRQQLRDIVLAAWVDYQATGLHVTMEGADSWLARLERGEDGEPPTSHR